MAARHYYVRIRVAIVWLALAALLPGQGPSGNDLYLRGRRAERAGLEAVVGDDDDVGVLVVDGGKLGYQCFRILDEDSFMLWCDFIVVQQTDQAVFRFRCFL